MKKEYQAPLATLVGFVSKQNVAVIFDFDDLRDMVGSQNGDAANPSDQDVDV